MRKSDYALLAQLIKTARQQAVKEMQSVGQFSTDESKLIAAAEMEIVSQIGFEFSQSASVDKIQFLKACGIEP